jgi:hypothetical protein
MSPEQLDSLYRIPLEHKAEFLKRSVLLGRVFCSLFEGKADRERAQEALSELSKKSFESGVHPVDLFKEAMKGTYELPAFMEENLSEWEESLKYLVYGNPVLESRIPGDKVHSAEEWARNKVKEILDELIEEEVYRFPASEA